MLSYYRSASDYCIMFPWRLKFSFSQDWGVVVLVGIPNKDDSFKTHPVNFLNERTLKGTFFGNYKPCTNISSVVDKYMNKVSLCFCYWTIALFSFIYMSFMSNWKWSRQSATFLDYYEINIVWLSAIMYDYGYWFQDVIVSFT